MNENNIKKIKILKEGWKYAYLSIYPLIILFLDIYIFGNFIAYVSQNSLIFHHACFANLLATDITQFLLFLAITSIFFVQNFYSIYILKFDNLAKRKTLIEKQIHQINVTLIWFLIFFFIACMLNLAYSLFDLHNIKNLANLKTSDVNLFEILFVLYFSSEMMILINFCLYEIILKSGIEWLVSLKKHIDASWNAKTSEEQAENTFKTKEENSKAFYSIIASTVIALMASFFFVGLNIYTFITANINYWNYFFVSNLISILLLIFSFVFYDVFLLIQWDEIKEKIINKK